MFMNKSADNDVRGRAHLRSCDELFLIMEFQNVVSAKEINIGKTTNFNKSGCFSGQQ